jgi:LPXTG-motif cell wall-anchored protein
MYKYILAETGTNWMALFALLTFFVLFVISAVAIFGRKREFIEHMANLPLDDATATDPGAEA